MIYLIGGAPHFKTIDANMISALQKQCAVKLSRYSLVIGRMNQKDLKSHIQLAHTAFELCDMRQAPVVRVNKSAAQTTMQKWASRSGPPFPIGLSQSQALQRPHCQAQHWDEVGFPALSCLQQSWSAPCSMNSGHTCKRIGCLPLDLSCHCAEAHHGKQGACACKAGWKPAPKSKETITVQAG